MMTPDEIDQLVNLLEYYHDYHLNFGHYGTCQVITKSIIRIRATAKFEEFQDMCKSYRFQHDDLLWPQMRPCKCHRCERAETILAATQAKEPHA
jgi:hypothetical protein